MVDGTDDYEALMKRLKLGATGKFPEGKLNENDQGELRAALIVNQGRLVLLFGKPVEFLAMTKEQAIAMGQGLIKKAQELP